MADPPFDFTASFLTDRESSAGSAWIVIMASLDGDASKLTTALALIGARVDLVATYEDVMQLTDKSQDAPDLLYMMADEIGGLEHAIRLYRGLYRNSGFGKCVIFSTEAENNGDSKQDKDTQSLILRAPGPSQIH
jgi:hypothetical protein